MIRSSSLPSNGGWVTVVYFKSDFAATQKRTNDLSSYFQFQIKSLAYIHDVSILQCTVLQFAIFHP